MNNDEDKLYIEEEDDDSLMSEKEAKEEIDSYRKQLENVVWLAQVATFLLGTFIGKKIFDKLTT